MFIFFRLLRAVCREAVLAQGARPSQPGHVHEPPPKSTREETLLNCCTVPELDPAGELSHSESIRLRLGLPLLLTFYSLPLGCEDMPTTLNEHCGREEDGESGGFGTIKHDRGGLF